ncbi:MAG: InlB B-repeat-containing protein [Acholeplasmatales bacterium]|nr:InlB B-repeat-containing protein [Acholeplasmatales bacterium]
MNKKKSLLGASALTALATIALVSCGGGGDSTKSYTITLDVNDSSATLGTDTDTYTVSTAEELLTALASVTPTKTGYNFVGWFLDDDCETELTSSTDLATLTADTDGAIYIYAGFEIADYTVTFDLKGNASTAAVADKSTESVKYKGSVTGTPTISTPALDSGSHEMTFTGWYTSLADATAGDTTKAVTPTTVTITQNTTFYAGWTIVEIATEADFLAYVNATQKTNAYISADITLSSAIDRTAAGLASDENMTNGTDQINSMQAKLYGDDHTITGLTINADLKSSGLWGKFSGTLQDINFASTTVTASGQNAAVIAGTIQDGATFTDVTFDGVEFTHTASNGYAAVVAAQVKDAAVTATFDGVTIKGLDMNCVKYSAGILATVVGANAVVNFTDCLVEGDLVASGESNGLVFGYANKDKSTGSVLTFDGVVVSGSIEALKNVGGIVGNNKDASTTIVVKNSAAIALDINITSGTASQLNTFVGQNNGTVTLDADTCFYQTDHSTLKIDGVTSSDTTKQGTAVNLETLATKTLSSNITFSYASDTKTLTTTVAGASFTAYDPTVLDLTNYTTVVTKSDNNSVYVNATTTANDYNVTGVLKAYEAAISGLHSSGVLVTFALPTYTDADGNVTTLKAYEGVEIEGLYNAVINTDGTITGYIMLDTATTTDADGNTVASELDQFAAAETAGTALTIVKTVSIVWANNSDYVADAIDYTFNMKTSYLDLGEEVENGTMSMNSTLNDLTSTGITAYALDTDDSNTLNITAGKIAYGSSGNIVYVDVTMPSAFDSTKISSSTIELSSNATLSTYAAGVATIGVKISAKGDTKFTINWNETYYDDDAYVINVADAVTLEANASASGFTATTYNFDSVTTGDITSEVAVDTAGVITLVATSEKKFTVDASAKSYTDVTGASVNSTNRLKTNGTASSSGRYIKIDLTAYTGNVKITVACISGSSSADRSLALYSGSVGGTTVGTYTAPKASVQQDSVTCAAGTTYYLGSSDSGVNIYAILIQAA